MALADKQLERYSRQILLKEIGEEGQEKLLRSKVLIIGAGGLGSPASLYLGAAGVGFIGSIDADAVDLSNLQRQIVHAAADIGRDKVLSLKESVEAINPEVRVEPLRVKIGPDNIRAIVRDYDFILDCTDNFDTKILISDACVLEGKPFCHAGVKEFRGQVMTYVPGRGPCLRRVTAEVPPGAARPGGIMGATAGLAGCLQALEAIKYLTGAGELLTGSLLILDTLRGHYRKIKLAPCGPECPVCGRARPGA